MVAYNTTLSELVSAPEDLQTAQHYGTLLCNPITLRGEALKRECTARTRVGVGHNTTL